MVLHYIVICLYPRAIQPRYSRLYNDFRGTLVSLAYSSKQNTTKPDFFLHAKGIPQSNLAHLGMLAVRAWDA